jgi:hypothetical protein
MATNFYFNNFSSSGEQNLIENLIIESIRIHGVDTYYVPRTIVTRDNTFREQSVTEYGEGISIEMYIKNIDGFEGDGEFLSKFGVEVRDQITFSVAMRVFDNEVGSLLRRDRPLENDLVWFPFNKHLYQIKFVNKKPIFYQMGALQMYDVVCELFEYSNEVFNTGIDIIDNMYNALLTTTDPYAFTTEVGFSLVDENGNEILDEEYNIGTLDTASQNDYFESEGIDFLDFSERDPFSEIERRA